MNALHDIMKEFIVALTSVIASFPLVGNPSCNAMKKDAG